MRPGLVSANSSQEKDVGGLLKKGKTASTTQMTVISTFSQKAKRRKYRVSDTLDPAQHNHLVSDVHTHMHTDILTIRVLHLAADTLQLCKVYTQHDAPMLMHLYNMACNISRGTWFAIGQTTASIAM